jgi:hypothetical protein
LHKIRSLKELRSYEIAERERDNGDLQIDSELWHFRTPLTPFFLALLSGKMFFANVAKDCSFSVDNPI